jgi:predicted esterase
MLKRIKMSEFTYTQLINQTIDLYQAGQYQEAYDFITANADKVQGNPAGIYNFRYCIASKAGHSELALDLLREAVIDKGLWYAYDYLFSDDDLVSIRDTEEFKSLAAICRDRETAAKKNNKAVLKVIQPREIKQQDNYPVVIALHGNGENIALTEGHWLPCTTQGCYLALLQSAELTFFDSYSWNDFEQSAKTVQAQYSTLIEQNNIDSAQVILGGFSAGARAALYATLKGLITVQGLVLVGPWLPQMSEWETLLDNPEMKQLKFYLICGDRDEDCLEGTQQLKAMLDKRGIACQFHLIADMPHSYPEDFDTHLEKALAFIRE